MSVMGWNCLVRGVSRCSSGQGSRVRHEYHDDGNRDIAQSDDYGATPDLWHQVDRDVVRSVRHHHEEKTPLRAVINPCVNDRRRDEPEVLRYDHVGKTHAVTNRQNPKMKRAPNEPDENACLECAIAFLQPWLSKTPPAELFSNSPGEHAHNAKEQRTGKKSRKWR